MIAKRRMKTNVSWSGGSLSSLEEEGLEFDETLDLDGFEVIANSSTQNFNGGFGDTFNFSRS